MVCLNAFARLFSCVGWEHEVPMPCVAGERARMVYTTLRVRENKVINNFRKHACIAMYILLPHDKHASNNQQRTAHPSRNVYPIDNPV